MNFNNLKNKNFMTRITKKKSFIFLDIFLHKLF